jgi:hypothetical protein
MTPPFADAKAPEVCARVLNRLVIARAREWPSNEMSGPRVLQSIIEDLEPLKGSLIYSCALACQVHMIGRVRFTDWYWQAIRSSRLGYGFRRCWFGEYKANRRK